MILKLTAIFMLALSGNAAVGQDPLGIPDFSATQISQVPPGVTQMGPLKVYKSGTKFRTERAPGQIVIWDPANDKVYSLSNGGANCMILALKNAPMMSSVVQLPAGTKIQRKPVGTDVVEGHTCTVEEVELTSADGTVLQTKMWEANDLHGFPVKIEALGHPSFTFLDIVLATPDAALFQPPGNCRPLEKIKPRIIPTKPTKPPNPASN